jgi:hypothetical protein
MTPDQEMEAYARDCIRLAGLTVDPTMREPLLKMARGWMEAAAAERSQRSRKQSQRSRKQLQENIPSDHVSLQAGEQAS